MAWEFANGKHCNRLDNMDNMDNMDNPTTMIISDAFYNNSVEYGKLNHNFATVGSHQTNSDLASELPVCVNLSTNYTDTKVIIASRDSLNTATIQYLQRLIELVGEHGVQTKSMRLVPHFKNKKSSRLELRMRHTPEIDETIVGLTLQLFALGLHTQVELDNAGGSLTKLQQLTKDVCSVLVLCQSPDNLQSILQKTGRLHEAKQLMQVMQPFLSNTKLLSRVNNAFMILRGFQDAQSGAIRGSIGHECPPLGVVEAVKELLSGEIDIPKVCVVQSHMSVLTSHLNLNGLLVDHSNLEPPEPPESPEPGLHYPHRWPIYTGMCEKETLRVLCYMFPIPVCIFKRLYTMVISKHNDRVCMENRIHRLMMLKQDTVLEHHSLFSHMLRQTAATRIESWYRRVYMRRKPRRCLYQKPNALMYRQRPWGFGCMVTHHHNGVACYPVDLANHINDIYLRFVMLWEMEKGSAQNRITPASVLKTHFSAMDCEYIAKDPRYRELCHATTKVRVHMLRASKAKQSKPSGHGTNNFMDNILQGLAKTHNIMRYK